MNYNQILYYIAVITALSCFCTTFVRFEPIRNQIKKLYNLPGKFWSLLADVFTCSKCFGLWFSVFFTTVILKLNFFEIISLSTCVSVFSTYLSYITNKL